MKYKKIKEINEYKSESINPMKTPDTIYELYSVPFFAKGCPEYLHGSEIGSSKVIVRKNDVLVCKINPRINRVWVVSDESDYQSIASSEWIVVRSTHYNPYFLAWYFRTPMFQQLMTSEVTGIGGSLTRAQPKRVAEYPVPVLPREKQDQIVAVLNHLESIKCKRKRELDLFDNLVKARFIEMFGDPVKNEKGWPMVRLGELAEVKIGPFGSLLHREDYIEGGHALINPSHIVDGKIIIDSKLTISDAKYEELASYIMHIGDVVLGRRGEMGRCAVVDEEGYLCGTGSMILRSGKMMKPYFLQNIISSPSFRRIIEDKAVGVTMKNLNVPIVSELMIPKLPVNLQEQYLQLVEQSDKSKSVIQKSLDETQILFQSLMQEYFG